MLNKTLISSKRIAHISLAFVGLMWVLPFLNYFHAYPITTFYQEWMAGLLGLCAMPLLLTRRYWQAPEVPRIVLLPISLMLIMMTQFLLGRITHFDYLMLLSLYFLFAALLMMLGQALQAELGLPWVAITLSFFLLAGGELNTLAGVLQHYSLHTFLDPVVTVKTSVAVYGNIAQPNHFADYLTLGLLSLGLLYVRFGMRRWGVLLLALPMLFVLVLSGSRSTALYLLFALGLAYFAQRRDKALRPLWHYSLAMLVCFILLHYVVQLPWFVGSTGSVTMAERLFGDTASGGIRIHLWRESLIMFSHFPVLGAGFGQFALQHVQLAPEMHNPVMVGLYNNAHNLFMQIAVEAGLIGLIALVVTLGLWVLQAFRRTAAFTLYHWWGYSAVATLGIHSMLEYPLWYAYFIGIAALMLGLFDTSSYKLELRQVGRLSVASMILLGAISLGQVFLDYHRLEKAVALRSGLALGRGNLTQLQEELGAVQRSTLLSSYSALFIANTMEVSPEHLAEKLALNQHALSYVPIAPLMYHQAELLAWADRADEAKKVMSEAIWAYSADFPTARQELSSLASRDPARFSGLLEFATQKYEEYRSAAVSAK